MEAFNAFLDSVKTAIVDPIITLIALGAFVVFVWGVVDYISGAEDQEKRQKGQQHMIWGVIGLVVIFGARAIIAMIANTIGADIP